MSSSAITTQVAQLKIGNVQNQADTSAVYSAGVWSFKNSTALTSVTITDAGNVGVGATTTSAKLTIKNPSATGEQQIINIQSAASTDAIAKVTFNQTTDALNIANFTNIGALVFGTGGSGTERMRIDSSGNVGIGTASPTQNLHVHAASSNAGISLTNSTTGTAISDGFQLISQVTTNDALIIQRENANMIFRTFDTERMRIDASGNLLVGTTAAVAKHVVYGTGTVQWIEINGVSGTLVQFRNSQAAGGNITIASGGGTSYNTSSDYRLKEDVQPISAALSKVTALKPCTYKWKADGSEGEGFIAHELAEICPIAVSGEKDAVNEDGSIKAQGIDPSKLVALLTAAIQELSAKVDAQAEEIKALKAQP